MGRVMHRSPGVGFWYLATAFASFGLLSIVALDAWRGQSHDHLPAGQTSSAPEQAANRDAPKSRFTSATEPNSAASARSVGTQGVQQTNPTPPVLVVVPPPAVASPSNAVQSIPPWSFTTVTITFTKLGRLTVASTRDGGKRSQNCLALWDLETHMTKEEWKVACERSP
jgi:hypothetical protein